MADLRKFIKYLQPQENIDCCTSSATLVAAEILCNQNGISNNFSRLFVYYMTRRLEGRLDLSGSSLRGTFNAIKEHGVCLEKIWPFDQRRVNVLPSPQSLQDAANYRINSHTGVHYSEFNNLLENNIPVVVGLKIGHLFWKLKGRLDSQLYKSINNTDNKLFKGHAVTIVGFDNNLMNGSWIIANSLGPKWGDHGYGILPYECSKDIGEAYIIKEFAGFSGERKISNFDK